MTVNKGTFWTFLILTSATLLDSYSPPLGHSRDDVLPQQQQQQPSGDSTDDRTLLLANSNSYSGYPYAQVAQKPYGYSATSYQPVQANSYQSVQANSYPSGGIYAQGGGGAYNSYGGGGYSTGYKPAPYGYSSGLFSHFFGKGLFSTIVPFLLIPLLCIIIYSIFFPFSVTLPSTWGGRQGDGAMEQATFMIQRVLAAVEDDNCRQRQACEAGLYAKKLGMVKDTAISYVEKFAPAKLTPYLKVMKEAASSSDEALNYCDQFACPSNPNKSRTITPTSDSTSSDIPTQLDVPLESQKRRFQPGPSENQVNKNGELMK